MTDLWLGYADRADRRELITALQRVAPGAALVFADSPEELRLRLHEEEPGTTGVIVGHISQGVSEVNLAAALAHDGTASEVVLVARHASGSLRSRASRAGITRVEDAAIHPQLERGVRRTKARLEQLPDPSPDQAHGMPAAAPGIRMAVSAQEPLSLRRPAGHLAADAGPVLALVSGRGGVGKTALAALLACIAASWDMDVALVDLDLSCGNLHASFGVGKPADLARITHDGSVTSESMARASVHCTEHVRLWGPCERPEMAELVMPHVSELLAHLAAQHQLVVVDTSTTFTDAVAQAVQACDRLVVVHDEGKGAVAAASRVSSLAVRLGVARTRIVRVINLADPHVRRAPTDGRVAVGLETARVFQVSDGGVEAEELLAAGRITDLVAAKPALVDDVASFLAQVLADLGRLPETEAAQRAAQHEQPRRRGLFGLHREVA